MQRAPFVAFAIDLRTMQHEPSRRLALALPHGEHQRLLVKTVFEIDVRAVLQKELHHRNIAAPRRNHHPGAEIAALEVRIETGRQPLTDRRPVALFDPHTERDVIRQFCRDRSAAGDTQQGGAGATVVNLRD